MERSSVYLLFCILALAPGGLFFSTAAQAIPAQQLTPGNSASLQHEHGASAPTGQPAAHAQLTTSAEPAYGEMPHSQEPSPAVGLDCGQGLTSDKSSHDSIANIPCPGSADPAQRFAVQLGRRVGTGNGILGEFDGVRVDYRLTGDLTLNGIAGYPVRSDADEFNTTRQVFGVSAATGLFASAWDLKSYFIEQQEQEKAADRAIGGVLRHLRPERSLLVFLDYNLAGNSMDALMASGAWKLPGRTTLSATLDLRRRPPDSRQQKYLQHSMSATEGWNWILPVDRLAHYTGSGTGEVSTLALGWSHAVSARLQLKGDVAMLDAVRDATSPASKEYLYHLKLTGKDLLLPGHNGQLDLRHSIRDDSRISTAALDTRYTIKRSWKFTPAVRADYRIDALENVPWWTASPSLKMEYRWKKQHDFKFEAGGAWTNRDSATANNNPSPYFLKLGYKMNF